MKNIFVIFFLFISLSLSGQDTSRISNLVKVEVMQNKIENLENRIEDYKQHDKELHDAQKDEVEKLLQEKGNALDSRMLIYVSIFVAAFVIVLGFFRWLGKEEIRKIATAQAIKQIDEQLKIKLSKEMIDEKLILLGKPVIEQLLNEISASNQKAKESADALEESSKKYSQLLNELTTKNITTDPSKSTAAEKAKIKEFNEVLNQVKDTPEFTQKDWFLKGKEAYNIHASKDAILYFDKSISLNPVGLDAHYAYYYRGLSKFSLEQYEDAIADFDIADNFEKTHYVSYIRAVAYELLHNYSKALENIDNSIKLKPDNDAFKIRERIMKNIQKTNS